MFGDMFPQSYGFVTMPVTSRGKDIYPCLIIVKGDEIVRPFDRHSNETATVRKHVTKYKHK